MKSQSILALYDAAYAKYESLLEGALAQSRAMKERDVEVYGPASLTWDEVSRTRVPASLVDADGRAKLWACGWLSRSPEGATLLDAIKNAEWGAQPDGSFVTRQSHWPSSIDEYSEQLSAPAKQGELCAVSGWDFVRIQSRASARAEAAKERAQRRAGQVEYQARRIASAKALVGKGLPWHHGQEGGYVEFGGATVSARGALAAAGVSREVFDSWWEQVHAIEEMHGGYGWDLRWVLFADGFAAVAKNGRCYVFGAMAEVWAGFMEPRIRDPRHGKVVFCETTHVRERRMSKRIAKRQERRFLRNELRALAA